MKISITMVGLLLVAGCASTPTAPAGGTASPVPARTAAASSDQLASPTASSPMPPRATQAQATDAPVARPPDGLLAAGGTQVAAWLGTYCWDDNCVDAPPRADKGALPRLEAAEGDLTFRLADGALIGEWVASYTADPGGERTQLARGGTFDPDVSGASPAVAEARFEAPPPGDWVVHVQVFTPDGDASYWWHVIVE